MPSRAAAMKGDGEAGGASQGGGGANSGAIGDDPGAPGKNAPAFLVGWDVNAARRPSGGRAAGWKSPSHALHRPRDGQGSAVSTADRSPSRISRSAIDSGFSCTRVSTSGPTYSSRPSPSWA